MNTGQSLAGYVRTHYEVLHRRIHFEGVKQETIVAELVGLGFEVASVQVFRNAMARAKKIIQAQPEKPAQAAQTSKLEQPKKRGFEFKSAAQNNLTEDDI